MDATTRRLADYASSLRYEGLTQDAVREAKRHLLDTLGCLLGGFDSPPAEISRRLADAASGTPCARVLGTQAKSSIEMATFANTVMLRYLDYNDTYISVGSGHPSDMVAACLAVADAVGASGRQTLLSIVVAYEIFGALADQVPIRARGWDQGVFVVLGAAAGAAVLLGLDANQTGDALAIAITANVATRQTRAGELAMWKGCATAAAARAGVFAALLAKEGMTGPTEAFEGFNGAWDQVTGKFDLGPMGGGGRSFAIERTNLKFFPSEYHSQAPMWMALNLRSQVQVSEIAQIDVKTYHIAFSEIGSEPEKWNPQTRETADHSLPYLLALALMDGEIRVDSFTPDRMHDPATIDLMRRIRISESDEFTARFPNEMVTEIVVTSTDGSRHREIAAYPRGHSKNPMTDAEVDTKFSALARGVMEEEAAQTLRRSVWDLDKQHSIRNVLELVRVVR
jgi:2-methylcitrate dehydratase